MGQRVGKSHYTPEFEPFLNLPTQAIRQLWTAFNDIAEGFGLTPEDFTDICLSANVHEFMNTTHAKLKLQCRQLFRSFDTDDNGLVDALEFLATFALVSGMNVKDKIDFVFDCYDFDESGELTVDEMTLSFKSTLCGLTKMTGEEQPTETELEAQAATAFLRADQNDNNKISRREFHEFCNTEREVKSWIMMFDSARDVAEIAVQELDSDLELEANFEERSEEQALMMGDDIRAAEADPLEDDDLVAARPWIGGIVEPTDQPENDASAPFDTLELEWVHGYRGSDCRNNVRYAHSGKIVYHAAALGVVLSKSGGAKFQAFHNEHTDDVVSFATWIPEDGSRTLVATGEVGRRPKIIVWDTDQCRSLCTIVGFHRGAVIQLAFSPDGSQLLSVGQDARHSVAVYALSPTPDDRLTAEKIYTSNTSENKVLDAMFVGASGSGNAGRGRGRGAAPTNKAGGRAGGKPGSGKPQGGRPRADGGKGLRFVTCGVKHVDFWAVHAGETTYRRQSGLFGSRSKVQNVLCIADTPTAGARRSSRARSTATSSSGTGATPSRPSGRTTTTCTRCSASRPSGS
jgi:Ca2+-binding EF-hand superfamily protein